mmetsp:Transcript_56066/g.177659  ORF Transcript_56066/g.177659 Transcript_56066/m.177659 type:complete len:300 (+) Transcript_56066:406-1305(+)
MVEACRGVGGHRMQPEYPLVRGSVRPGPLAGVALPRGQLWATVRRVLLGLLPLCRGAGLPAVPHPHARHLVHRGFMCGHRHLPGLHLSGHQGHARDPDCAHQAPHRLPPADVPVYRLLGGLAGECGRADARPRVRDAGHVRRAAPQLHHRGALRLLQAVLRRRGHARGDGVRDRDRLLLRRGVSQGVPPPGPHDGRGANQEVRDPVLAERDLGADAALPRRLHQAHQVLPLHGDRRGAVHQRGPGHLVQRLQVPRPRALRDPGGAGVPCGVPHRAGGADDVAHPPPAQAAHRQQGERGS